VILGAVQPHIQVDDFLSYVSRQTLTKTISALIRVAHQNKQVHTTQTNTLPAVDWFRLKLPLPFVPMSFILSGQLAFPYHTLSHTQKQSSCCGDPLPKYQYTAIVTMHPAATEHVCVCVCVLV